MKILSKLFCCFKESEEEKEKRLNKIKLKRIKLLPNYNKIRLQLLNEIKNIDIKKY